jgi:NitT/TauT family transport system ATP-binding protein
MLTFRQVTWTPTASQTAVLKGVDFSIGSREFCCVVGPSGAGKTSLLRLAAGLVPATDGEVIVNGQAPDTARASVSYVFQHPVLFPWRTARENVLLPLEVRGERPSPSAADDLLNLVRLDGHADMRPAHLSGGMQSRVAIARALVTNPRVLLMDEPFADLDEINREHLNFELQRIWQARDLAVVFVTHDLAEAVFLADRIIVMSARPGQVFADIPVSLPRPRNESTLDTEAFESILREVRHSLRAATRRGGGESAAATPPGKA